MFFENAGGALTLKSVVETSGLFASYPDNQGRDNPASKALMAAIDKGKADMRLFFNAPSGQVFVGESGTEVLFRLIRTAALGAKPGGIMLSTTLEHPASRSAMARWAEVTGRKHVLVPHDDATGNVGVDAYLRHITPDVRVATIIHTSPVTGMSVDVGAIAAAIRKASPDCYIVVDGIQHASHGAVDIASYAIDGYAISPYKVFSRHGYGVGWASDRLTALPEGNRHGRSRHQLGNGHARHRKLRHLLGRRELSRLARRQVHGQPGPPRPPRGGRPRHPRSGAGAWPTPWWKAPATCAALPTSRASASSAARTTPSARAWCRFRWRARRARRSSPSSTRAACGPTRARPITTAATCSAPWALPDCVRVSFSHYNTLAEVAQFLTAINEYADNADDLGFMMR